MWFTAGLHCQEADADSTELPNLLPERTFFKEYEAVGRTEAVIADFLFDLYQI